MKCMKCGSHNVEVKVGRYYSKDKRIKHDIWMRRIVCFDCGYRSIEYGDFSPKVKNYCEVK